MMAYNRFNYMYLLRAIYANGNQYKTVDEIFNLLDPTLDRPEFDRQMLRLKQLIYLDEHTTTHKIKVNSIGETQLILLDRQEDEERKRLVSLQPEKKPLSQIIKTIVWTYILPAGKWTTKKAIHISIEIIIAIAAAYLIFKFKIPH